jgi:predicted ATPase
MIYRRKANSERGTTMFTKLRLERFKGFKEAELSLGPFTLLVGTNASGKSNVRDAFRFLHGVGRGYSLAEIFGEKWGEGGERQWRGIRGGTKEAAFAGTTSFALEASLAPTSPSHEDGLYRIEVEPGGDSNPPRVVFESLRAPVSGATVFDASAAGRADSRVLHVSRHTTNGQSTRTYDNQRPVLTQVSDNMDAEGVLPVMREAHGAKACLRSMRFFDFYPDATRQPSFPGQATLGDQGENLSGVLLAICQEPTQKRTLVRWLQELTPMDATDLEFAPDPVGRIHLMLVEQDGRRTSAYSASDGTLRYLAMLAALFGPQPARFYFIEELESGIHPTRLHLVLELMERIAAERNIQIVATTHSPQLLGLVQPKTLEHAALTYRLEGRPDAHIKRILDIPEAKRVLERQDLARLHASGWLEDMVYFTEEAEAVG